MQSAWQQHHKQIVAAACELRTGNGFVLNELCGGAIEVHGFKLQKTRQFKRQGAQPLAVRVQLHPSLGFQFVRWQDVGVDPVVGDVKKAGRLIVFPTLGTLAGRAHGEGGPQVVIADAAFRIAGLGHINLLQEAGIQVHIECAQFQPSYTRMEDARRTGVGHGQQKAQSVGIGHALC